MLTDDTPSEPAATLPSPTRAQDLFAGTPGVALLYGARAGLAEWTTAHTWARAMTRDPVHAHPDFLCLSQGAPAVAFALREIGHRAYGRALDVLDDAITAGIRHRLGRAHERIDRGELPALREYDLVGGMTGLGAYLLHQGQDTLLLRDVLGYLTRLTHPIRSGADELPGWWTRDSPGGQPSPHWPGGHLNLGIAHGCAGVLTLLSTAMRHGVTVPEHVEAMARITDVFDAWRRNTPRPWWPGVITRTEWHDGAPHHDGPQRPSWCYGTPGQARAQQLAGLALGDAERRLHAEAALLACVTDPRQLALLNDASVCHGWAGLLQATRRAAADADDAGALNKRIPILLDGMHRHLRRRGIPADAGLLTGRAGVSLVEHGLKQGQCMSSWDTCLLLTG
ncbi:lanthionine synthetase C family protein [Embleya sp. NPDC055664]